MKNEVITAIKQLLQAKWEQLYSLLSQTVLYETCEQQRFRTSVPRLLQAMRGGQNLNPERTMNGRLFTLTINIFFIITVSRCKIGLQGVPKIMHLFRKCHCSFDFQKMSVKLSHNFFLYSAFGDI